MGEQKTESRKFIEKLIAFDTTSYRSNLDLIHTISDYLAEYGIQSQLVFNVEHTKANLFATIGPQDKAGVMLSGHTDVVPVEGQNWRNGSASPDSKPIPLYLISVLMQWIMPRN